jgi:hypothetical protein
MERPDEHHCERGHDHEHGEEQARVLHTRPFGTGAAAQEAAACRWEASFDQRAARASSPGRGKSISRIEGIRIRNRPREG